MGATQGTRRSLMPKIIPVRFVREAADELEAAAHWYEEKRVGLGI